VAVRHAEDDPASLARMYRRRTAEPRDRVRSVRFTRTAVAVIDSAAAVWGKTFAGFVGDAAYAVALGRVAGSSAEDDPLRPLVEVLERLVTQLRRVGSYLNQVARAGNAGEVPAYAVRVLARVETAVELVFEVLDGFTERRPG
jgi:hypothetical protein